MSNIIYGKNSVKEALKVDRIKKIYLLENSDLLEEVIKKGIPYEICSRKKLDNMSKKENHQGVLAEVKSFQFSSLEKIIKDKKGFIVMIDNLNDVHNLGAIIRTCECAGVDGIIYKKHQNVRVNETVAKVASGALEYVNIVEVTNLNNTIRLLKEKNYWIYGADADGKNSYQDFDYQENIVLIIGGEGKGISHLLKEECDYIISLPLKGNINSLNASVAAGILIYEVLEKRNIK